MKSFSSDQTNTLPVIHGLRSQPIQSKQLQKVYCDQCGNWHEDIDSVEVVADDILVWGTNETEHDSRLINALDRT